MAGDSRIAAPRTWPELRDEVQSRADRNAYPLTGMKPDEVREVLGAIDGLDRDAWAEAWSAVGTRHAARATNLESTDRAAAADAYLMAFRYFAFGGWPAQNSPGKQASFQRSVIAFRKHAALSDPPIESVCFPFDGHQVAAFLALPKGVRQAPVVLAVGGLDSYKEYWGERVGEFLKAGLGILALDMPGTGEAPVKADVGAERMYSAAIDYLKGRSDVDSGRLAALGVSWGGHWSAVLGFTEKDRLRASVYWGGPIDRAFQADWQLRALGTREYLFDLLPARASAYRVSELDEFLAYGPRMSLKSRGFVGKPSTPMLLVNGERDTQVPVDDLLLLLRTGTPKEAWVNPEGGHLGRGAGWPDGRILSEVIIPWLARQLAGN